MTIEESDTELSKDEGMAQTRDSSHPSSSFSAIMVKRILKRRSTVNIGKLREKHGKMGQFSTVFQVRLGSDEE